VLHQIADARAWPDEHRSPRAPLPGAQRESRAPGLYSQGSNLQRQSNERDNDDGEGDAETVAPIRELVKRRVALDQRRLGMIETFLRFRLHRIAAGDCLALLRRGKRVHQRLELDLIVDSAVELRARLAHFHSAALRLEKNALRAGGHAGDTA